MSKITHNKTETDLNEKITNTLKRYSNEENISCSDGFDILRWARQGKLQLKIEEDVHNDNPFDYYIK